MPETRSFRRRSCLYGCVSDANNVRLICRPIDNLETMLNLGHIEGRKESSEYKDLKREHCGFDAGSDVGQKGVERALLRSKNTNIELVYNKQAYEKERLSTDK